MLQLLLDYVRRCGLLLPTESVGLSVTLASHTKTAETIEMPFALRTRVGPRNHVLDIAERFETNTALWPYKFFGVTMTVQSVGRLRQQQLDCLAKSTRVRYSFICHYIVSPPPHE